MMMMMMMMMVMMMMMMMMMVATFVYFCSDHDFQYSSVYSFESFPGF